MRSSLNPPFAFSGTHCNDFPHSCGNWAVYLCKMRHGMYFRMPWPLHLSEETVPPNCSWWVVRREHLALWQSCCLSRMGRNTTSHTHTTLSLHQNLQWRQSQISYKFSLEMRRQYWWLTLLEPACVTEADGKYVRKKPSLISPNILQWFFTSKPSYILFVTCQVAVLIHHDLSLPLHVIKPMVKMTDRCKQDSGNYITGCAGSCLNIVLFLPIKQVHGLHSPRASDRGEADYIMTLQCRLADQTKWISLSN